MREEEGEEIASENGSKAEETQKSDNDTENDSVETESGSSEKTTIFHSKNQYRSGGTGGTHPGMDFFPDLSPRAKPYCRVKCSRGLHFPATNPYSWKNSNPDIQRLTELII